MASRWGASSWTASSTWESDHLVRLSLRVCSFLSSLALPVFLHFRAFALHFSPPLESQSLSSPLSHPVCPPFSSSSSISRRQRISYSICRVGGYSTRTLPVFSRTQALSGSYMVAVRWFRRNLGSMCALKHCDKDTHCTDPHTAASPSLRTQTRTGVVNHITQPPPSSLPLPRSQSLSLTPSGLIPEFVLKLLSSSSIPCFLGFSQVSNPISPSTQSQQVWINCQAT